MPQKPKNQMSNLALETPQNRNECKHEIKKIFDQILHANSALRQLIAEQGLSFTELESLFIVYQQALLDEVDFLPMQYFTLRSNHPFRQALALSNLNTAQSNVQFLFNLTTFTQEINQSHVYPRTRQFAAAIGACFFIVALVLIARLGFCTSLNFSSTSLICAVTGLIFGIEQYNSMRDYYKPIYHAQDAGNRLANFFTNPKPHISKVQSEQMTPARHLKTQISNLEAEVQPPPYDEDRPRAALT